MRRATLLGALAVLALVGCSGGQDVGDANKPPPPGAAKLPSAPPGSGGPAAPTQQSAQ